MSNGWDFESGLGSSSKAEFTKFPEGITRIRVIDEEPHVRWTHWMQAHKRSINCPGKGCPICEIRKQQKANGEPQTYNMARRFAINILNRETGKVEIMEQGITFFQDLRDIMQDLKDDKNLSLQDADLKVRRRGTGKDNTSYRIDIDEIYPMSESDKEKIKDAIDLNEYFKPNTPEQILRVINGEDWNEVMKAENSEEENIEIS